MVSTCKDTVKQSVT